MADHKVFNNEQLMHFEIREGDSIAFMEYRYYKNNIAFMHTDVPQQMEGKGIASTLAAYAFEFAKQQNKKVMVYCPFVSVYLKRHPELRDQLDKKYMG